MLLQAFLRLVTRELAEVQQDRGRAPLCPSHPLSAAAKCADAVWLLRSVPGRPPRSDGDAEMRREG